MKPCKHPCCPDTGPCKKAKKPKQRKAIPKTSKKQRQRTRKYIAQKKVEFADDNVCAVALLENKSVEVTVLFKDCQYHATQKHHPAGRLGDRLYDPGIKLCGTCHSILEVRPDLAKSLGLSESRLAITPKS